MEHAQYEEKERTIGEKMFKNFKNNQLNPTHVPLPVMYDKGWNKRLSGNKYYSILGYEFLH